MRRPLSTRLLAALLGLAAALPGAARADAGLLVASAASSLGAKAAADFVNTPYAGIGVFGSWWDSQDFGRLEGYGLRLGWNLLGDLGLEARGSYLEADSSRLETTLIALEGALTWRFPMGRHVAPYIGAGVGYYMKDAEYTDADTWEDSEDVAGYFGLGGLNLYLGPLSLFAEAKYNLVGTDEDLHWRGSDVDAQNSLDGLSVNAGLKLGF